MTTTFVQGATNPQGVYAINYYAHGEGYNTSASFIASTPTTNTSPSIDAVDGKYRWDVIYRKYKHGSSTYEFDGTTGTGTSIEMVSTLCRTQDGVTTLSTGINAGGNMAAVINTTPYGNGYNPNTYSSSSVSSDSRLLEDINASWYVFPHAGYTIANVFGEIKVVDQVNRYASQTYGVSGHFVYVNGGGGTSDLTRTVDACYLEKYLVSDNSTLASFPIYAYSAVGPSEEIGNLCDGSTRTFGLSYKLRLLPAVFGSEDYVEGVSGTASIKLLGELEESDIGCRECSRSINATIQLTHRVYDSTHGLPYYDENDRVTWPEEDYPDGPTVGHGLSIGTITITARLCQSNAPKCSRYACLWASVECTVAAPGGEPIDYSDYPSIAAIERVGPKLWKVFSPRVGSVYDDEAIILYTKFSDDCPSGNGEVCQELNPYHYKNPEFDPPIAEHPNEPRQSTHDVFEQTFTPNEGDPTVNQYDTWDGISGARLFVIDDLTDAEIVVNDGFDSWITQHTVSVSANNECCEQIIYWCDSGQSCITLYSTGEKTTNGIDDFWKVETSNGGGTFGLAVLTPDNPFLGFYVQPRNRWIGLDHQGSPFGPGERRYRTTIFISGGLPTEAITGRLAADDGVLSIAVNGTTAVTGPLTPSGVDAWESFHSFSIPETAAWIPGNNIVDFVCRDESGSWPGNVTGINVQWDEP